MENLINETNKQLQGIIFKLQKIGREYEDKLNENADLIENEKEKANKYKKEFATAEAKINKMNSDIQGFENDYNHLVEKFQDDELSNILVAANKEISAKIDERKKKILKDQIAMNALVQKAESVKTKLVKLYAEKKVLEYCYQQIVDAYDYYSTELGKIISYSNDHRDYLCECYEEKEIDIEEELTDEEINAGGNTPSPSDEEIMAGGSAYSKIDDDIFEEDLSEEAMMAGGDTRSETEAEIEAGGDAHDDNDEDITEEEMNAGGDAHSDIEDEYNIDMTSLDEDILENPILADEVEEAEPNEINEELIQSEIEIDNERPDDIIYIDNIELDEIDNSSSEEKNGDDDVLLYIDEDPEDNTFKELDAIIKEENKELISYLDLTDEEIEKIINNNDDLDD